MADVRSLSAQELERQNQLLKEREQIEQRMEERNKRMAVAGQEEIKRLKKRNEEDKTHGKNLDEQLKSLKDVEDKASDYVKFWADAAEKQEDFWETSNDFASSFAKMTPKVKELLTDSNNGGNQFAAITARILSLKKQEINASGDELESLQERRKALEGIRSTQVDAAEELAAERENVFGITDAQRRRQEFQASIIGMNEEDRKLSEQIFQSNENLIKQSERLVELQKQQDGLLEQLPEGLQSALTVVKDMIKGIAAGLGPIVIMGALFAAALSSFTEIQEASKKFRQETGLTNSQTKQIQKDAHSIGVDFAKLGVDAGVAYDSIAAFKSEFGDTAPVSKAVAANVSVLNKNFGVAQKDAAAVNMIFQSMAGLSAETAQGVSQQVADMAKLAGVAPSQVFKDIADSAADTYTYFKGDVNLIAKQAIEARRLGTTLKDVLKTTESLLDFETGIEKELVAATFVGGQFNLSQARALAYAGRHVDAQKELLRQVERSGKFADQDMFTKKALADATGKTVEELTKQILMQEKLGHLSEEEQKRVSKAMDAGLDITNMSQDQLNAKTKELAKQEEIADKITQMENSFKGIVAAVGEGLLPLMEALAPIVTTLGNVFGGIFGALNSIPGLFPALIGGLTTMYILSKKTALLKMKEAIASIFAGNAKLGPLGLIAAGAGIASLMSYMGSASVKDAGDVLSPANGRTQISTKEGGLVQISPNDDLVAAPNAISKLNEASRMANMSNMSSGMQGGGLNANSGVSILINEVKKLREDMGSGKIKASAFLDGIKITSGISNVSENSTRNNFSYGQR